MKFRVERDALTTAVTWTAKSLPTRPSVPVLAGALLKVEDGALTISGFDYEISSQVTVGVEADAPGTALVSGRLLAEIVKALPAKPVEFAAVDGHAEITCGSARFTLPTMPVEDYPALPAMPGVVGTIPADVFATAVSQVAVAAGRDDTLPTMTGVQVEMTGTSFALLATDRYRMAVRELDWSPVDDDVNLTVLIPAKALSDTAKSFGAGGGDVTIAMPTEGGGTGLVGFSVQNRHTTSRVLDGQLPKLRSLLPTAYNAKLRVTAAELVEVSRRVALVAERDTRIQLRIDADGLVVEAGGTEDAKASEAMDCVYDGEPMTVAFNSQYLLDGLSAINAQTAVLSFTDPMKPVVLTGAAPGDDDEVIEIEGYKYLLQPLRFDN
ncbi:DNA polymerase III subunit beta [Actinorhabdospora filicis]|uniref:Beta sliding clamp n=1 Tax=Actinorhabdospora filicis TaxID=1785913 RepID=A0A9W6SQN1_9ACTN|nr:DNA polymerase III subunit beta [Actinorhabdospora filicis]GLZ81164.1 DNA polymerase III subunit beta [Actinorhabdospora filicis]